MGEFQEYIENQKIIKLTNQNAPHIKAAIVERFNRTIKNKIWRVFTYLGRKQYSNILQKLVQSYNNSFHRSIGTAPSKVTNANQEEIHNFQYGDPESHDNFIEFKFKIGDYVRIIKDKDKDTFEKGYVQKWSSEICVVIHQNPTNPPTYSINNTKDKLTLRPFYYAEELQKVQPENFPYDTYEVEIHNNTATITQLNDENQETQIIENYKINSDHGKKKRKILKRIKINLDRKKKIRKRIKTRVIPYALANNAYASIILPKLKRFKYDHDKIIKPKPNIYINYKSDEIIDGYYNLPNPIELNGSYQAFIGSYHIISSIKKVISYQALYKIDIENKIPINNYELTLTTINLENDNYLFEAIKDEQKEYLSNIKEYKPEYIENNFNKKNEDLQTLLNKEIENLINKKI